MYKVSDATKNAYKTDSAIKSIVVRIPDANITLQNEDILADSLELKEAIETRDNLSFEGCIASSFKIDCFNLVDETLEGKWIECDIEVDVADTDTIPLFRGYISEVTNTTHEEFVTSIRAYDALYTIVNTDVTSWYNGLTFPITCKNMRNSFFTRFGITQVVDYLPNDNFSINKTIEDKVIVGGKIIRAICQLNGRYGRISRTGKFEYVHLVEGTEALYPREDLFPADDIYPSDENALDNVSKAHYKSISFENYTVAPIDKVQFINKEGQIIRTAGTGTNIFTLKDNPLIWGKTSAQLANAATNLFNTVRGLWYVPSEVECVGLPYVECGDFVLMSARRSIVRAYVLSRTLKGIQILEDSYSADGDKKQPKYVPDIQTQTNANAQAITTETSNRITAVNNEASARASAINSEATARINADTVNANAIKAETVRAQNVEASKASVQQLNATNANVSNLNAQVANVKNLVATKASISQLEAESANIKQLTASAISAESANIRQLVATKASIDSLNATNANISNLSARVANVDNLVAQKASVSDLNAVRATVNYISATYVTADKVSTAVNNALQGRITCGELRTGSISIFDGSGYTSLYTILDRRYVRKN